ncbi:MULTISPECIES: hypothetical protein [Burkholderia]|uniref:hypothetical protein n=1 Tax=Burkholderia gladioli TaxID=28095 RepID=UPI00163F5CF9|nr:hypothetical protein [Burkholderia gladioli]
MKSHDFAKHLALMAQALRAAPNIELESSMDWEGVFQKRSRSTVSDEDIPHALNMLVGLNNVSKQQWLSLIEEFGFVIDVRPRDANRDIFGKLLKFLAEHPEERVRLVGKKSKKPIKESEELANALTILMR